MLKRTSAALARAEVSRFVECQSDTVVGGGKNYESKKIEDAQDRKIPARVE
jgi:hypothetical protein